MYRLNNMGAKIILVLSKASSIPSLIMIGEKVRH